MGRKLGKVALSVLALTVCFLAGERKSQATMIGGTDFNIEYWTGSGVNQAVMVVDFRATGGASYCFGYLWDGAATGYDMVLTIAAEGDLDFTATTYTFGTYIDNFSYGTNVGNVDYYWQYFVGTPAGGGVDWSPASEGMATRALQDGCVDGWYNGFDGHTPLVPEPASVLLMAAATALIARRRTDAI